MFGKTYVRTYSSAQPTRQISTKAIEENGDEERAGSAVRWSRSESRIQFAFWTALSSILAIPVCNMVAAIIIHNNYAINTGAIMCANHHYLVRNAEWGFMWKACRQTDGSGWK